MWKIKKQFKRAKKPKKENLVPCFDLCGVIIYTKESGHSIDSIHLTNNDAESYIEEKNKKSGQILFIVPVHVPGTHTIMYLKEKLPKIRYGVDYFASMRAAKKANTENMAIALWDSKEAAIRNAKISESMIDPNFIYTYIGGPVQIIK
jgi:hypothetical protein